MSTSLLCQEKRKALATVHMTTCLVFYPKGKKFMWKLVLQNDEFLDAFSQLGLFSLVTDEVITSLEKFMCALYGYKNETTVKGTVMQII